MSRRDDASRRADMRIYRVSPHDALRDWDWYERQINRVITRADSGLTTEDVLTAIQYGRMHVWRSADGKGMGLTELQSFPRYRQLFILMVAGEDMQAWIREGSRVFERFARENACTRMEFHGRPGWEKIAEECGFTHKMMRMKKRLD